MARYHVFIERPRETGGAAVARLAAAVGERYGLPAPKLLARLGAGRVRVKAGVDRATAETLCADLERLGAVCAIVDSDTGETLGAVPAAPAPRAATPAPFASGLSAAASPSAQQELGALWTGEFSLATLDGKSEGDADDRSAEAFAPPGAEHLPASIGPAMTPALLAVDRGRAAAAAPIDLFAPPDADAPPPELALEVDPRERRGGTTAPAATPAPAARTIAADPRTPPPPPSSGLAGWIRDRRIRLAAGVLVAILLGFVPATVVASLREGPEFDRIDDEVTLHYQGVKNDADHRALDPWLATQRAHKRDVQRNIALGSMVIWALAGAVVAFVWFRKVDWDALADRLE